MHQEVSSNDTPSMSFLSTCKRILDKEAPQKRKFCKGNHVPIIYKTLCKVFVLRTKVRNILSYFNFECKLQIWMVSGLRFVIDHTFQWPQKVLNSKLLAWSSVTWITEPWDSTGLAHLYSNAVPKYIISKSIWSSWDTPFWSNFQTWLSYGHWNCSKDPSQILSSKPSKF